MLRSEKWICTNQNNNLFNRLYCYPILTFGGNIVVKSISVIMLVFAISAHAEDISLCKEGWSKSTAGEYEESLNLFNKCIENGDLSNSSLARTYRNIGITQKNYGQYAKAIESYNKALSLNPSDPWDDYVNRGNAWSESGNFTKAFEDYDKALEIKPNYNEVYYNRGIVFEKKNDFDSAKIEFERAYELGLRSPLLLETLAAYGVTFVTVTSADGAQDLDQKSEAAGFAGTLKFFIGRAARDCKAHLDKNDEWMHGVVKNWMSRNSKYAEAAEAWMSAYLTYIARENGMETGQEVKQKLLGGVTSTANSMTNEIIKGSQSQKKQACVIFEKNVVDGIYDITNESPFYEELESLVMIVD